MGKKGAGSKQEAQYLGKENKPRSAFIRGVSDFLKAGWIDGIGFSVID
jgi:hypothetical protein